MRTDRELLEDALDLIAGLHPASDDDYERKHDVIEEIRVRLTEPEEEPVAWIAKGTIDDDQLS